jgi:hypothetical protein
MQYQAARESLQDAWWVTVVASRLTTHSSATTVGLAIWLVALIALPSSLPARVLIAAPLVVVPAIWNVAPWRWRASVDRPGLPDAPVLWLAALPVVAAFAAPPGAVALALSLPWLFVTALAAAAVIVRELRDRLIILRERRVPEFAAEVGLGFLALGAVFLSMDRLGFQPLGFSPEIVLLTAIHFHFAGFGLLALAATLAAQGSRVAALGSLGLVAGMPLTAAAFVLESSLLNLLGGAVVGCSGVLVALGLMGRATAERGWLAGAYWLTSGMLTVGMILGVGWAITSATGTAFLDLDVMVRTHGVVNAASVIAGAILAGRSTG